MDQPTSRSRAGAAGAMLALAAGPRTSRRLAALAGLLMALAGAAQAQTPRAPLPGPPVQPIPIAQPAEFEYAVKFVCGRGEAATVAGVAAPGPYFTAINVHNPSYRDTATFRHKVSVALPGLQVGPISWRRPATLRPDESLEIDCPDIVAGFPGPPFLKGFVVILSPIELDVVAVYSAGTPTVATLHTERVPARRNVPCPDLDLNLNTGQAQWRVLSGPGVTPGAAAIVTTPPWQTTTCPNARWVSATAAGTAPQGIPSPSTYRYEVCFCLCSGFDQPTLSFQLLADNGATAYLNGTAPGNMIATKIPPNGHLGLPATAIATATNLLRPGQNCITVDVQELHPGTPTGLLVCGNLKAKGGSCSIPKSPLPVEGMAAE